MDGLGAADWLSEQDSLGRTPSVSHTHSSTSCGARRHKYCDPQPPKRGMGEWAGVVVVHSFRPGTSMSSSSKKEYLNFYYYGKHLAKVL